jgi:hypothetical protein
MFGRTFYHDTLRKYVILFGTLFNDIQINREDSSGNVKQVIKVPLSYGPREKFLARIEGIDGGRDPQEQPFSIVLPRMGFEVTGFQYASERKLPTRNKFTTVELNDVHGKRKMYRYNPVPYDINFSLSIFVKNTTDGTRIIEQILPYFTPEWTTTVQLTEEPDITLDVPLVLTGSNQDDVYEGGFEERRALIWTLDFTMKGVFFGPTYRESVIKLANTQIFDATLYDSIADAPTGTTPTLKVATRILNRPGLLSGNTATKYADLNVVQATAVATIADGAVTQIDLTEHGLGYTSNTTVTITGGGGANATATALVDTDVDSLTSITVTDGGSGYTSTPTVTISTPDLESLDLVDIAADSNYGDVDVIDSPWPDSDS